MPHSGLSMILALAEAEERQKREPFYTCCEDGMLSQVPPTDHSGLCPACKPDTPGVKLPDGGQQ